MSHKLHLSLLLIGLCIATGLSAMYPAHFKTLLAAKNYHAIREAVIDSWPQEYEGLSLQWKNGELALVGASGVDLIFGGLCLSHCDTACGKALRTFIVKEILYPAMYGNKEVEDAVNEIEALAHDLPGDVNGVFGPVIFGVQARENQTVNAIQAALYRARGLNLPARLQHVGADIQSMADEIIVYVGAQSGEANLVWGKLPFTTKLWANRLHIWAVCAVAVVALYYLQNKPAAPEDIDEEEDEARNPEDIGTSADDQKNTVEILNV